MNEQEVKQACANMPVRQLLTMLKTVEANYNKVYPCAERYARISVDKSTSMTKRDSAKAEGKIQMITLIIFSVAAVVLFILSAGAGTFGSFVLKFLGLGAVVCAVIQLVMMIGNKSNVKKLEKTIAELTVQLSEAEAELNKMKEVYTADMLIRQWVCPAECQNPRYLRQFISFFENGRTDSLKEARNLFDEFMHRERMEKMAANQVSAARAAEAAAHDAMRAAQNAEVTASSAKNAADWAAYCARFYND